MSNMAIYVGEKLGRHLGGPKRSMPKLFVSEMMTQIQVRNVESASFWKRFRWNPNLIKRDVA